MKPYRVAILGNYGAANLGDEILLQGTITTLEQAGLPREELVVLSHTPEVTARDHRVASVALLPAGWHSFWARHWVETKQIMQRLEWLVLGGGELLNEVKPHSLFIIGLHLWYARRRGVKILILGNSVSTLKTWWGKRIVRKLYSWATAVTLRDQESQKNLRAAGFHGETEVTADLAFMCHTTPLNVKRNLNQIAITWRPWKQEVPKLESLKTFVNDYLFSYEVSFLAMQTAYVDDRQVFAKLVENRPASIKLLCPQNMEDLNNYYQHFDLVLGMRLHALIWAALSGVLFIAISYSDKVRNFCAEVGVPEVAIPWSELTFDRLKETYQDVIQHREEYTTRLQMGVQLVKQRAMRNVEICRQYLTR